MGTVAQMEERNSGRIEGVGSIPTGPHHLNQHKWSELCR